METENLSNKYTVGLIRVGVVLDPLCRDVNSLRTTTIKVGSQEIIKYLGSFKMRSPHRIPET